jgi:tetratricopeptide (TPR) repeat protein
MNRFLNFYLFLIVLIYSSCFYAETLDELLAQGDNLATEQFDNKGALDKYMQADKLSPNNFEVYWRLSRTYVDIAEHMPSGSDEQKDNQQKEFQIALDYAEKAVKLAPDQSICYLRRAIVNGKIALFKGVFTAISLVKSVKSDVEKSIKIGNGGVYVQSLSHYVLGRTHAKVCEKAYLIRLPLGLGWGDIDVAESELKKAISIRPDFKMFYYELSKVYIEEDENDKAKDALNKVIQLPKKDEDDDQLSADAKKMLKEL